MILALPISSAAFSTGRGRWFAAGLALLLAMALLFTYSRSAWFGTVLGIVVASLITRRLRLLPYAAGIAAVALLLASVLPRDVLRAEQASPSPRASASARPTATTSHPPKATASPSRSPSPAASDIPSSNFLGSAIDRALRIVGGSDLRTRLVTNAGPILADHLLLGVGPGRYGGAVADWYPTPVYRSYGTNKLLTYQIGFKKFFHQQTVDDFWLHLVVESGILGTLAFGGLILVPLLVIARSVRPSTDEGVVLIAVVAAGLVGVFTSLSTMLLESNSGAFPFWLLLGVGWSIVRLREVQAAT
jgi:O-antigen ligase